MNGDNVDKPFLTMADEIMSAIEKGEINPEEECIGVKMKANLYKKPFVKLNSPGNEIKLKQSECECWSPLFYYDSIDISIGGTNNIVGV